MVSLETAMSKAVFLGNGKTREFPFTFRVWESSELAVLVIDAEGTVRNVTEQCAITLYENGGKAEYAPGGVPLPAGNSLIILRNMPFLQEMRFITGTRFDPAAIEEALDIAAAERQQLLEKVNRAVAAPADGSVSPEEFSKNLFAAGASAKESAAEAGAQAARAKQEADRAESTVQKAAAKAVGEAEAQANRAKSEADRAANAVILGTQAENLEAVWKLETDIAAGGVLNLPISYFAGRNVLHLSYDGVELYRGPQYEEIGRKDTLSSAVKALIALPKGSVIHAWAVSSNVVRHVEEAEARIKAAADKAAEAKKGAEAEADRAEKEADRAANAVEQGTIKAVGAAEEQANRAESEANRAETARAVAQNAAQEATEQAERADEAALDAAKYRQDTYAAARCVSVNMKSRALASVREEELLEKVPSGFFVINEEIVVPATIKQPLTPAESVGDIPTTCDGFYLLVPPFENDCPPEGQKPQAPSDDDCNGHRPSWYLPCGKRARV